MTSRNVTETLKAIEDSVEVPELDRVAIQRRVVQARQRRHGSRIALAAAAAVAVSIGAITVPQVLGPDADSGDKEQRATQPSDGPMPAPMRVPITIGRSLVFVEPAGSLTRTTVKTEELLGATSDGVVVIGPESTVLSYAYDDSATGIGSAQQLTDGEPVQRAWLSKDGTTLTYVDLGNRVHVRLLETKKDIDVSDPVQIEPIIANGNRWVTLDDTDPKRLTLTDANGDIDLPEPQTDAFEADIAGDTVAVEQIERVEFFDTQTGKSTSGGGIGDSVGSLNLTGTTYAGGASREDVELGMTSWLRLIDVATGESRDLSIPDAFMFIDAVHWSGEAILVAVSGDDTTGLLQCDPVGAKCQLRYRGDGQSSLMLPTN